MVVSNYEKACYEFIKKEIKKMKEKEENKSEFTKFFKEKKDEKRFMNHIINFTAEFKSSQTPSGYVVKHRKMNGKIKRFFFSSFYLFFFPLFFNFVS